MTYRIVIVDKANLLDDEREQITRWPDISFSCGNARSEDAILAAAAGCDGIITYGGRITRRVLENLPQCRVVVRAGVGYDIVDVDAATEQNIPVVNIPDFCTHEVANHTVLLMLAWVKRLPQLNSTMRSEGWRAAWGKMGMPAPFHHETVGLVGFGRIARMVAQRLMPMEMRLLAYDPYQDAETIAQGGATKVDLETLLRESDYVSVHVPLSESTRHLIGAMQFAQMKPNAIIVNTARGPIIDEQAMIAALREDRIAGAALDVFEQEPLSPDSPLLTMENVIVTPHSAAFSEVSQKLIRRRVMEEAARVVHGYWSPSTVNRAAITPKYPLRDAETAVPV